MDFLTPDGLAALGTKDKPLTYIETHAGRGLYDLGSDEAQRTGEARGGILAVEPGFPAGHPYLRRLQEVRAMHGANAYPGSPMIAALGLRSGDVMHLAELHPQEYQALAYAMAPHGGHLHKRDGLAMALALCPPTPRRGLMLVDPSWEVKTDYETVPATFAKVHRKWNVGVLALWYPILVNAPHAPMLVQLVADFPGALRHEVRFPAARAGHRMTGSGMFVINPPWGTAAAAGAIARIIGKG